MLYLGVAEATSSEQTWSKAKVFELGQCVGKKGGGGVRQAQMHSAI